NGEDLSLDELVARHPGHREFFAQSPQRLDELRAQIEKLRQYESLNASSTPGASETPEDAESRKLGLRGLEATAVGPRIANFTIVEKLPGGGMGDVFKATQDDFFDRVCAVKTISPRHLLQDAMLARFKKEILAVSSLNHPQIVTVYNLVRDGNTLFLI